MTGGLQRGECCCVSLVVTQAQVDEDAVVAVDLGRAQRLTDNWQDAAALFAGALGDELLDPVGKIGDGGRGNKSDFVAPDQSELAEERPQHGSGVCLDGGLRSAGVCQGVGPA